MDFLRLPAAAGAGGFQRGGGKPSGEMVEMYQSLQSFDWGWLAAFLVGATLTFLVILFSILFFRRWGVPRLGYFFVTMVVIANRLFIPDEMFWVAFAYVNGVFSAFMAFYQFHERERVMGKEPVYFMLNAFSLIVIAAGTGGVYSGMAALSLFTSLFFVTTKNPRRPGRHGKAEPFVLEQMRRRAEGGR
ncbi:MAG: hypothetical protein AB1742_07110 [bacterium]